MSGNPAIRPARADDEQRLGELGAQLVAEHFAFDEQRFLPPTRETPAAYGRFLASQIGNPDKLLLVAERGGEVIAYIFAGLEGFDYMTLRGPAGMIYDLIVDPAHRRQGVGRMLLGAVFRELAGRGAPRVLLSTADKNVAAQAVFAASGFRRTMIEMTRELGPDDL